MPDFSNTTTIYMTFALVVPGLVITYFRAQFLTGRMQKHTDALLSYFALSAIYGAIALPIIGWLQMRTPDIPIPIWQWLCIVFLGPTILGVLLGYITRTEAIRSLMNYFGINPVHALPTAWDWKFGNMREKLVIVTLKDQTQFAGYCGRGSFMSSDPTERDLFIEKIYDWGDENQWIDNGDHGLWIASDEIRTIEFFPVENERTNND
ncbi:DUF6338 family protein [Celeribacter halophilus]|uniref:DUF6338 family protein n=1 Tax=Celeribacter halophilus TaxID=576117 RepID=A0AAW7Y1L7_9RHOB|nr:DUF6338 family protein [Celeribacter halophilus]MDO6459052.1 DUF6338 family protein [Celeribacter halophilus]